MATKEALDALKQTKRALEEIETHLRPFVKPLRRSSSDDAVQQGAAAGARSRSSATHKHSLAQAQAAVALSLGTLKYMGARLRGLDQGRKPDDPLRQELNQMRNVLVAVEKLGESSKKATKSSSKSATKDSVATEKAKSPAKATEKEPDTAPKLVRKSDRAEKQETITKRKSPGGDEHTRKKRRKSR